MMFNRPPRPELRLCSKCVQRIPSLTPYESGELLSRHFDLSPIRSITRDQMQNKSGDPEGWLSHVEESVLNDGAIHDPSGLVIVNGKAVIREGNHRAWISYQHQLNLPAILFTPRCGKCTEALFCDSLNSWTREVGWLHHQQGFGS